MKLVGELFKFDSYDEIRDAVLKDKGTVFANIDGDNCTGIDIFPEIDGKGNVIIRDEFSEDCIDELESYELDSYYLIIKKEIC